MRVHSRVLVGAVSLLVIGAVAAPAGALGQSGSSTTLTANGSAQVKPTPADRHSDTSIRQAVDAAARKALPLAVADARRHAADLAAAAGLTLGALQAISDAPPSTYPFFFNQQNGTFGNGHFCGDVRRFKTVRLKNGTRRRVLLKGTRRVCRVPSTVTANVALTYAVS